MTFPTPYRIPHEVYCGIAVNSLNNEVPAWEDPVEARAIGWALKVTEELETNTSRRVVEGVLALAPDTLVAIGDRFILPERGDGLGGRFDVIEVKDVSHGFHQWNPGVPVRIRRTPETRQPHGDDD